MNELVTLKKIEQSKLAIREVKTLGEIKSLIDQTEALRAYAESAKLSAEIQADIAELNLIANRRLGEISRDMVKAKGGQPYQKNSTLPDDGRVETKTATLAAVNIDIKRAIEAEKLAAIDEGVFENLVKLTHELDIPKVDLNKVAAMEPEKQQAIVGKLMMGEAKSVGEAIKQIAKEERQEEIEEQIKKEVSSPTSEYTCIMVDPPWNYGTQYDADGRRVASPYPEMSFEELAAIDIRAKPDSIIFLWTTHKFIWDAKKLLDIWQFEYRSIIVWDKEKMGMGDLFRMQCEFCLVGIKGKPLLNNTHDLRDIIREPRREHSRKPEAFYQVVNTLWAGSKLEYFAREQREGYTAHGNDTNKF